MPEPRQTRWDVPAEKPTKEIKRASKAILNAISVEPISVADHNLSNEKYDLQREGLEGAREGVQYLRSLVKAAADPEADIDQQVLAPTKAEAIQAVKALISAADISRGDITVENQSAMNLVVTIFFEELGDLIPQDRADRARTRLNKAILNYDSTQRKG